jgi:sirohydrochlorin ferrochelatase
VAFLEAQSSLDEAVARLADRGVTHILVVPYFLTLGIHLQRDLPGWWTGSRKCIRMWRFGHSTA